MVPMHHIERPLPSSMPEQSPPFEKGSEALQTPYSVSPSAQSYVSESAEDDPPSLDAGLTDDTHEYNPSIFSFPEHDTPLSQRSDHVVDDESQLKLDAQMLVDDVMRDAREKYQRMMAMKIEQDVPKGALNSEKPAVRSKQKSVVIADELYPNDLYRELCQKLNLSDPCQVDEIVQILASNAPHILKQEPLGAPLPTTPHSGLSQHLLLHPPFKPKRLIYLCPDGGIQILSAVDEQTNDTPLIDQQNYRLNYSNSAIKSSTLAPNDSSLAVEYETTMTTVNVTSNTINHFMSTESTLTAQHSLDHHQRMKSAADDPIVNIHLDLLDESGSVHSEDDDDSSLPEIFFKRIIVPERTPLYRKTLPTRPRRDRTREETEHAVCSISAADAEQTITFIQTKHTESLTDT